MIARASAESIWPVRIASRAPAVAVAAVIAASIGVRVWDSLRTATPWIFSDELTYSQLGRSLYTTGHLAIFGQHAGFLSLLYPALIGPPLLLHSPSTGYALLKAEQAVLMSLSAVPVYLWARTLVSRWWAVVAAALTLAVPGIAYSGVIMTEVAFYPIMVVSAWAMATTLVRPSLRNQIVLLACIVLAVATRVQAVVLVPAFVTAVFVKGFLDCSLRAALRRNAATLTVIGVVAAICGAYVLSRGGGAPLGGYADVTSARFDAGTIARFVGYHAVDVLLLTAAVPACATVLVVLSARTADEAVRAYAAVASALTVWLVCEVGVFASHYVGHLAERNLLPLAPVLFIGFAIWLDQGLRRPRFLAAAVCVISLLLLAWFPFAQLVPPALPDAFMLVPLQRLQTLHASANLRLVVAYTALPLFALFLWLPRRLAAVLVIAVAAVLVGAAVVVSNTIAGRSRFLAPRVLGSPKTWIDRDTDGAVAFIYSGGDWDPVFENLFWNRRIRTVDALPGPLISGPLPQRIVQPDADGALTSEAACMSGRCTPTSAALIGRDWRYAVAGTSVFLRGTRIDAASAPKLVLWRVTPPLRVATWLAGVDVTSRFERGNELVIAGGVNHSAELLFYGCRGGRLRLVLAAGVLSVVSISRNGIVVDRLRLLPNRAETLVLDARPIGAAATHAIPALYRPETRRGGRLCDFGIRTRQGPLVLQPLEFTAG